MNLNVETKTARKSEDLIMFLTRLLRVFKGLKVVMSSYLWCLLSKKGFALEQEHRNEVDGNVELVGCVEDGLKLEPSVVVAAVVVDVLAVEKSTLVHSFEHLLC